MNRDLNQIVDSQEIDMIGAQNSFPGIEIDGLDTYNPHPIYVKFFKHLPSLLPKGRQYAAVGLKIAYLNSHNNKILVNIMDGTKLNADNFWETDLEDIEASFLPQGKTITDLPTTTLDARVPNSGSPILDRVANLNEIDHKVPFYKRIFASSI